MISQSFVANFASYIHSTDPENLSDRELFETAQRIGSLALKSRRAFIGLLPLIERRRAYEGRTFYSIYDFAAKVGGVGKDIVEEVLRIDQYLVDTPKLRKKLYRGEIGWSKITRILHWVNKTNEEVWIEKLENLSKSALEMYLRDYQAQVAEERPNLFMSNQSTEENGVKFEAKVLPGQKIQEQNNYQSTQGTEVGATALPSPPPDKFAQLRDQRETFTFSMNSEIAARLRLFRQRLEKDRRELVTWEEVMVEFLKMIEGEVKYGKKIYDAKKDEKTYEEKTRASEEKSATRYIPAHIRHEINNRYGGLCAFKECKQPATTYHHTKRFSLTKHLSEAETHDPRFIKPLCTEHERMVHNTLIENEEIDVSSWKLISPDVASDSASDRGKVDQQVQRFRKPS